MFKEHAKLQMRFGEFKCFQYSYNHILSLLSKKNTLYVYSQYIRFVHKSHLELNCSQYKNTNLNLT